MVSFEPHPLLRNRHLMTFAAALWPRRHPLLPPPADRLFEVEPGTQVLARCHWQAEPQRCPTLVLVHGLEGSSESPYMLGIAAKAFRAGCNVLRMNQRTCGGTEHLTPSLYNSGLSGDYRAVLMELLERDALQEVFFAGYSMGGNLVLKMAGNLGAASPAQLRAVATVCPGLDLAAGADALALPENSIYEWNFLRDLRKRLRRKAQLFPERYRLNGIGRIRTLREWDDVVTAPHCGYRDANDYYARASALRVAAAIGVPTLILVAQDDPFIPLEPFRDPAIVQNPNITVVAPQHGGHCAFISNVKGEERFWAEARVVEFCLRHSKLAGAKGP